ncbi:MAG TPA: Gfo/Idh/MocA family oxidoreductase, partial [Humisphaera sp.]
MADRDMTRRGFLTTAGTGLLAAAANGAVPLAPPDAQPPGLKVPPGESRKLGWAIVGLGQLSLEEILPAFGLSWHARPVALVSGHPEKAQKVAEFYGVDRKRLYSYADFDRIKDDPAIDVVYVVLPNHLHAEYTVRALRAGKHVLCEKPMAATVTEARQMVEAAKGSGKKLGIAYRMQYEPFNRKAIDVLRSGELGKIQTIEAQNMQVTEAPNIRLSRQTAGGPLGDVGLYCLNAARYLTGEEPAEATGMAHKPTDVERFAEVPASVTFQLRFPSGALAVNTCGFDAHESRQYRVVCQKGWIELDNAFAYRGQRMRVAKGKEVAEQQIVPVNHFASEMDNFSDAVIQNQPVRTPGEEGLRDMVCMHWIDEAARTGRAVKIVDDVPNADKRRE